MSYELRAVIAPETVFHPIPAWVRGSAVLPLSQNLALIPCTTALVGQFGPPNRPWLFEAADDPRSGAQRSAVWRYRRFKQPPRRSHRAINEALFVLGVTRETFVDAFEALNLGRHRHTGCDHRGRPAATARTTPASATRSRWRLEPP